MSISSLKYALSPRLGYKFAIYGDWEGRYCVCALGSVEGFLKVP